MTRRIVAVAACLVVLSGCALHHRSTHLVHVGGKIYRTSDPTVLLAMIPESTPSVGSDCWDYWRITAVLRPGGAIAISESLDRPAAPAGFSCVASAIPMYQQIKLPVAYTGQRLLDARDDSRLRVAALPPGQPSFPPAPPYPYSSRSHLVVLRLGTAR